jgi:hypothetical protein
MKKRGEGKTGEILKAQQYDILDTFSNNCIQFGGFRSSGEEYSNILKAVASLMVKMEIMMWSNDDTV